MTSVDLLVWADGTANTEAYYSPWTARWVFIDHLNKRIQFEENWAEVTITRGDADEGLNQACFACDMEGRGVWVVEVDALVNLHEGYAGLEVLRIGTHEGEVLVGQDAEDWWRDPLS